VSTKCPICGGEGYLGLTSFRCDNAACQNYAGSVAADAKPAGLESGIALRTVVDAASKKAPSKHANIKAVLDEVIAELSRDLEKKIFGGFENKMQVVGEYVKFPCGAELRARETIYSVARFSGHELLAPSAATVEYHVGAAIAALSKGVRNKVVELSVRLCEDRLNMGLPFNSNNVVVGYLPPAALDPIRCAHDTYEISFAAYFGVAYDDHALQGLDAWIPKASSNYFDVDRSASPQRISTESFSQALKRMYPKGGSK